MWDTPRLLIPATPTRTVSFAPSTFPDALVPEIVNIENAALLAAAVFKKLRRVNLLMTVSLACGRVSCIGDDGHLWWATRWHIALPERSDDEQKRPSEQLRIVFHVPARSPHSNAIQQLVAKTW